MKRWYTQTERVDQETGEILSKSRIEREDWIRKGSEKTVIDKGSYLLNLYIIRYERSKQIRLCFE